MYEDLGLILAEARMRIGVEQNEIAQRLGVRQQAVSGWEHGKSRPRRVMLGALSKIIEVDEATLVHAGRYDAASNIPGAAPLLNDLPLASLPPDRFEALTAEVLAAKFPDGHASRFGGQGEKQDGIDVLVTGPDVQNLATAQCKRHEQFGPAAVAAAVKAVTIAADKHFLFLSRPTASPGARKEIAKHPHWELWDGADISSFIRKLPLGAAVRLVDTYFPGWREPFLGVAAPGPWLTPEEYFAEGSGSYVGQLWELVGRSEPLKQLAAHLYGELSAVAVLVGRGGIGKSRMLRAVAEAETNVGTPVYVLPRDVTPAADSYELLPSDGRLLVMLDDVHERTDINAVLSGIWRRNRDARALLATRPYKADAVQQELRRNALLPPEPLTIELTDLSILDAEKLAREALGDEAPEAYVQRLARLSRDTPLITVVGGMLIREEKIDLGELEHDDEIRGRILHAYREALVSDPLVIDPATRDQVLNAVAALQPFRSDDEGFKSALTELTGKPFDVLAKHLRGLEEAGILRRRGSSYRVAPDLLGDVILSDATYDKTLRTSTGYLDRVRTVVDGQALQHLFVNVSRIDWLSRQRESSTPSLVDSLWGPLERELHETTLEGRRALVQLLSRVAYFQPEKIVDIAIWLLDNPLDEPELSPNELRYRFTVTNRDIIHALPEMLKPAAYTFETLPRVLNLLWQLAQDDARPTNQFSSHPMRVLHDLCEYQIGKPLAYNDIIVDTASHWFTEPHRVSPFEVLEPLLATEGSRSTYQEYTLTFQPFPINIDAVLPIRERVLGLAFEEIRSSDPGRAVAAVQFIEKALRYPSGMYGRPVDNDEREKWTPDFIRTIELVGDTLEDVPQVDPVVLVAVRVMLNWHATYSSMATKTSAQAVIDKLRDELPDRIALVVHDGWGRLIYDRETNYEKVQALIDERLRKIVQDLETLDDSAVFELVSDRLRQDRMAFRKDDSHPGPIVSALVTARPALGYMFLRDATDNEQSALRSVVPVVLAALAEDDPHRAIVWAETALASADTELRRLSAQALGWNRGRRLLSEREFKVIMTLAKDADPSIRQAAVFVAQRLAEEDPGRACRLVAAIDFSDNSNLADEIFMIFNAPFGLPWRRMTASQRGKLRARLVAVPSIDQYSITQFLAEISAADPVWVIKLLQDRVTYAEGLEQLGGYDPMPHHWATPLRVREHASFSEHLRRLHAWIAAGPTSWVRTEIGSEIFRQVARSFDEPVLAILSEVLESGNVDDLHGLTAILRKAQRTFIWDHPDFVVALLAAAERFGEESSKDVIGALWGATISGVRTGTPGQPYPEDVEQRDRSTAVADSLPAGSAAAKFYRDMARSAERTIIQSGNEDRVDDGRDW